MLHLSSDIKFPSYSTFRRVLQTLNFQPLTDLFNNWAATTIPLMPEERLAVDGKSIRCTVCDYSQSYQNFISVVSVFSHQRGIVVRTQPLANKSTSELAVVQQLRAWVFWSTSDVYSGCFALAKKTVSLIVNSANDYLIGLKQNQPTLYKIAQSQSQQSPPLSCATTFEDSHPSNSETSLSSN